jgi:hypothetical protein
MWEKNEELLAKRARRGIGTTAPPELTKSHVGRLWTEEEDAFLLANPRERAHVLAAALHRSIYAINARRHTLRHVIPARQRGRGAR